MSVQYLPGPLGLLRLSAQEGKLREIAVVTEQGPESPDETTRKTAAQLEEYFSGKRREFTVELAPVGTAFQQAVWTALRRIPYGKVTTYGALAAAIGRPTACRAVANAVGKNPVLILLPCHRVVASGGIGGFTGGLHLKRRLLTVESIEIAEKTPFSEKFLFTFD